MGGPWSVGPGSRIDFEFEAKALVREKVPEPLQTVKAYAHLLAADKKIKIEPKPEPKP